MQNGSFHVRFAKSGQEAFGPLEHSGCLPARALPAWIVGLTFPLERPLHVPFGFGQNTLHDFNPVGA